MPRTAVASHRLRRSDATIDVIIDGADTLVIEPSAQRIRVGMVMPGITHLVDVSAHPSASLAAVRDRAGRHPAVRAAAEAHLRESLDRAVSEADAWSAPVDAPLLSALGGAAFPILGSAYGAGAGPLDEVPRWAVPVVAASIARDAARAAFGAKATRPVVAALGRSLQAETVGPVNLANLAAALMGLEVLEPDHLARVLAVQPLPGPSQGPPSGASILAAQPVLARWGARRTLRILVEALQHPEGFDLLNDTVRHARSMVGHGPRRLPNRLDEIHDAHRILVRTDATPRPPLVAEAPPMPEPAPRAPGHDRRDGAYRAPSSTLVVTDATPLRQPPAVEALDGVEVGILRIDVPRTVADLRRWSRALHNCLDTYGASAAEGRTSIIGVRWSGSLCYAIELSRSRVIVQFLGPANRPPAPRDREAIVRLLIDRRIIDVDHPRNRHWITDQ